MTELQLKLKELSDPAYAVFQAKLIPNIPKESVLGVRIPLLRRFAKEFMKKPECREFLNTLPHEYYDENLLHSIILSYEKDYDQCLADVEAFLPYIDNWAVSDGLNPKIFRRHKEELPGKIRGWAASGDTYTCRAGVGLLMYNFLDEAFRPEYLEIPAAVISEEYYVNMMLAWFFATALAKQWEAAIPYLTEKRLGVWVHNKTIQKAIESYRITPEQKEFLRGLRRKPALETGAAAVPVSAKK